MHEPGVEGKRKLLRIIYRILLKKVLVKCSPTTSFRGEVKDPHRCWIDLDDVPLAIGDNDCIEEAIKVRCALV